MPRLKLCFEDWKFAVDDELFGECSMTSDDLPDIEYYCLWEAGSSPRDAALEAISNLLRS